MKLFWITLALGLPLAGSLGAQVVKLIPVPEDPYQWLEDVSGEKALDWVRARNAESGKELAEASGFEALKADLLKILDSKERIPFLDKHGPHYYNFWKDAKNPQGLWRRTTLEEYRKPEPKWDVLLDLDALNETEKENWVWKSSSILKAGGWRYALVNLSRGGADATVVREYDLKTRSFVKGGFELPESKGELSWIDQDSVYVGTDFGPGTMTSSGYPRIVKLWKRGTPLSSAQVVFEGRPTDVAVGAEYDDTKGFERHLIYRVPAFFRSEVFLKDKDGKLLKVEVPEDAKASAHREWLIIEPRSAWTVGGKTYAAGSLLAATFDDYMAGKRDITVLFEPTLRTSLAGHSWTRHHLILNVLEDVKNTLSVLTPEKGGWTRTTLPGAPGFATVGASGVDAQQNDDFFMTTSGYLTPTTFLHGTVGQTPTKLKELPAFFDAAGLEVSQHFVTSKDGTMVPYFQVSRQGFKLDGTNPTLLYGYGGFEVSTHPGLQRGHRPGLAHPGWCLRRGQHPWRRRIRPPLAPGGPEGKAPSCL